MRPGRVLTELLVPESGAGGLVATLERTLRCIAGLARADGAVLRFQDPRLPAVRVGARGRSMQALLAAGLDGATDGRALARRPASSLSVLRVPLRHARRAVGTLVLAGRAGRLRRAGLPAELLRALPGALERAGRLHRDALRLAALTEVTRLAGSREPFRVVLGAFAAGVQRLVGADAILACRVDAERRGFVPLDVPHAQAGPDEGRPAPCLDEALLRQVVVTGRPLTVDDLPAAAAEQATADPGWRSAALVPLTARDEVLGIVTLVARRRAAFAAVDVEAVAELARPLATALEQRRLLAEGQAHAEELAALYGTSRLIGARLDLASVLEAISRSVASLTGGTGCGIGLLDDTRTRLVHVAAHGFRSEAWRALSLPVGEGVIGRCAQTGVAIRVDDIRVDPRSARRDVDEQEGIRSMLCVPLTVGARTIGVISAFATRPGAFSAHHQRVLDAFAEQAGIAIHNAQLFDESVRRGRETRALLEAGQAVTASLDVERTMRVIMEQARSVLCVESCGIMTLDPATGDLVSTASLDLPSDIMPRIRVRPGEGIAGIAVETRRPAHSSDLWSDPRVRFPEFPRRSGFRSMLSAPLRVGERAIGAISVFRRDTHRFVAAEEELLLALADQAAIALEHARLYAELEGMVAERTRELDAQRRFVEVVLETLPLGVFVLDTALGVVRANREGERVLGSRRARGAALGSLVSPGRAAALTAVVERAFATRGVHADEQEVVVEGEAKLLRLTAAPVGPGEDGLTHVVLLLEDVTLARRLEQQMLLTERLTTAGRLAAGVAHELNNPLATIAGCAESLLARAGEVGGLDPETREEVRHDLALIEEEAYRCKEITGSLLQFVRDPGGRRAPTDLNALAEKTLALLAHQSRFAGRRFVTELDPGLPALTVNEGQMRQVFLGLASNALEAMGPQGTLTVRSCRTREGVEVEFVDEGPGIAEELQARIFEPFFTTKPPGQGTGLGLAIAQGIVADHGGRIVVASRPGHGSAFRVLLPS